MTCHNRKNKTITCIQSLERGNKGLCFKFVVVDDNSTDGTREALEKLPYDIIVIHGDGSLFWNGGMYAGLKYLQDYIEDYDSILLVNDDVDFLDNTIYRLYSDIKEKKNAVMVGTTVDTKGKLSYGGVIFTSSWRIKYLTVSKDAQMECDTFNANCVLIPNKVFAQVGNLDPYYKHAMGDFDYGMSIRRKGFAIYNSDYYVGTCNTNSIEGSWQDKSLSRRKRLDLKESAKGLPQKDWFYFAKKNFGIGTALYHSITPYLRILFRS